MSSYMVNLRIDGVIKEFEFSNMENEWIARKTAQKLINGLRDRRKIVKFISIRPKVTRNAL